uniref:class I SAM-dependent methyltransferase n=1 Tax=Nonlabens sp. Ci31 TaxID=2608253 RepID=UPI001F0F8ABD|nr:class I SAM-dependent methyltransferase [Nonlabens sp. Ci31]
MKNKEAFRNFWYQLSPDSRFLLRKIFFLPLDIIEKIKGRNKYVPSRGAVFTGGTAGPKKFLEEGKLQLQLLRKYTDVQPDHKLLDIGCGMGRTAIAFTPYLKSNSTYHGFDPVKKGIDWCKRGIGADFSNFHFTYVDLFNDLYKSKGGDAAMFKFPYSDNQFNVCFTFSVFTHMAISEIQNYLNEMYRVSHKDACCLSTFFLYNSHNETYISTRSGFSFPIAHDGYRLMHADVTAGNIAIQEDVLRSMISTAGFREIEIIDGFWKDERYTGDKLEYQDIVIFKK